MAPYLMKPEIALKRAEELVAVGQSSQALQNLHELMISKRYRQYTPAHDQLMHRVIQLSVHLRKNRPAKECLHAFKNLVQNIQIESLEAVIHLLLDGARLKLEEARLEADRRLADSVSLTAKAQPAQPIPTEVEASETEEDVDEEDLDDEEAAETPESVMMRLMGGGSEDAKDRTDREVVAPWMRFQWEAFRSVLDVLKNNSKLESLYQTCAAKAFEFCLKYGRKSELRRLCELLRNHLLSIQKSSHQAYAINLNHPDSLQMHLNTRFIQLQASTDLELWQEAFRSVEDIFGLLRMAATSGSRKPPKPAMMTQFYEALTKIFWVSDQLVFHAAAMNKRYVTVAQCKSIQEALKVSGQELPAGETPVTAEETKRVASLVILSTLSVPVNDPNERVELDLERSRSEAAADRLTALLGMTATPTRHQLIRDFLNRGLLKKCDSTVKQLYNLLEVDFHPLTAVQQLNPLLEKLSVDPSFKVYVKPLYNIILSHLIHHLSRVYTVLRLDTLLTLANFPEAYRLTPQQLEKSIVRGCERGEFSLRINHLTRMITFDSSVFSAQKGYVSQGTREHLSAGDKIRNRLFNFSQELSDIVEIIESESVDIGAERVDVLRRLKERIQLDHEAALERKEKIERRKEIMEAMAIRQEQKEARERALRAQQEAEAERVRLEEEARKRELDRIRREREEIDRKEAQKLAEELQKKNIDIDAQELDNLDKQALMKIQLEQLDKEKRELADRIKKLSRRVDHTERAYRIEEIPLLEKAWKEQKIKDKEHHEQTAKLLLEATKRQYEQDIAVKKRLLRMKSEVDVFRKQIESKNTDQIAAKRAEAAKKIAAEKEKRIQKLRAEKKAALEKERKAKEEKAQAEAAKRSEEEEKQRKEEERLEKLRVEKEERMSQMKEAQAAAQRQMEREREAEERARQRALEREKQDVPKKPEAYRPPQRTASTNSFNSGSSEIRRSAPPATAASPAHEVPSNSEKTDSSKSQKYVPPWMRKK